MTTTTTDPHDAIATTILEQLEQAWNAADGAAFGAPFADESDFVDVRGEHHRGAAATSRTATRGSSTRSTRGAPSASSWTLARPVAGAILAVATSTLDAPSGPLQGIHTARFTMVIAEQGDDWRHHRLPQHARRRGPLEPGARQQRVVERRCRVRRVARAGRSPSSRRRTRPTGRGPASRTACPRAGRRAAASRPRPRAGASGRGPGWPRAGRRCALSGRGEGRACRARPRR